MWTQSCSHDILCPPAEGKEYREAAFNWISFPDPVNPALLFTQVRGTMCQSSATLMCCVPCPRFMAHFTLCHRAASQWSGPRTGVLIGQPLPISKTNNSWRYCGRHLTFSRVVFVCWIIQHVPAPVCVPHWNVHVWDVVVFRGPGRKKRKQALTWWVWQVRVQIQYTLVLCSHCREVDLLWFVQMQKRFSVTNLDLFTNVVFQLAQLFFLCCGHSLYFQNKTRSSNFMSSEKVWPLLCCDQQCYSIYVCMCTERAAP